MKESGKRVGFLVSLIFLKGLQSILPADLPNALNVSRNKQLFVDHRFVESSEGITLSMHEPFPTGEKLVVADQPWEKGLVMGGYCTVLRDEHPDGPVDRHWYAIATITNQSHLGMRL